MDNTLLQEVWIILLRYGTLQGSYNTYYTIIAVLYELNNHKLYLSLSSEVCIATLRGHGDSINAVHFLPYTNSLITASADKTISHWDIRTVNHIHLILIYLALNNIMI